MSDRFDQPQMPARADHTWACLGVLLVFLFLYIMLAASSSLFDRDEPRFARAAVEMFDSGHLLVPTLNMDLRPDKPPMVYWLMQGPLWVLGPTELAVRLPSIVGMLVAVWLTGLLAWRLYGPEARLLAMVLMGSALLPLYIGTGATADGTLIACILLAQLGMAGLWFDRVRGRYLLLFFLGVTLGQLTKGPVALAVPLLTLIGALVARRWLLRSNPDQAAATAFAVPVIPWWKLLGLTALSVLVFLAWFIPADQAVGGRMWSEMVGRHLLDRMVSPAEGHGGSGAVGYVLLLPLYLPLLIGLVYPWTMLLPAGVHALAAGRLGNLHVRAFLWGWVVPNLIMFSLVATKLPHYVLPIVPALMIMMAGLVVAHRRGQLSLRDRDWLRGGIWFYIPVTVGFAVTGVAGGWWVDPALGRAALVPAVMLAVVAVFATRWQLLEQVDRVIRLLLVATIAGVLLVAWLVMPVMEDRVKPAPRLAQMIRADMQQSGMQTVPPVHTTGYGEPSFVFYMNLPHDQRVLGLGRDAHAWQQWLATPGPAYLVTTDHHLDRISQQIDWPQEPVIIGRLSLFNYAGGAQRRELIVISRDPHRPSARQNFE